MGGALLGCTGGGGRILQGRKLKKSSLCYRGRNSLKKRIYKFPSVKKAWTAAFCGTGRETSENNRRESALGETLGSRVA